MDDLQKISPLLDNWTVGEKLPATGSADVYIVSSEGGSMGSLAILKHYSYPKSEEQLKALFYSGTVSTDAEAREYIAKVVKEQAFELSYMKRLKNSPYVFTNVEYQIVEKTQYPGFEIYVLMDYCETLGKYLKYNAMTHLRTINLAIDMCSALEDLRAEGLIHQNLKPNNIYISTYGQYMLGDFGFSEISRLDGSYVPEHYISEYSAPELSNLMGEPNVTIDIYSLGLILYRILNANHAPFEDENTSAAAAKKLRESGNPLPSPMYADYELGEIILKACAFKPEDRYQTPTEFKQVLKDYYLRNTVPDELIVPPINVSADEDDWNPDLEEKPEPVVNVDIDALDEDFKQSFMPAGDLSDHAELAGEAILGVSSKSNKGFWIGMLIVCLIICISGFFALKYWPTVEIYAIDTEVAGSDVIIVSWQSGGYESSTWDLVCTDAYGNKQEYTVGGSSFVLSGLTPGTQYGITLAPAQKYVRTHGVTEATVSTISHTTIAGFEAKALSSTAISLSWTINGTSPDVWNVTYQLDGKDVVKQVSGNTVDIDGLVSGDYYTFTLSTDFETLVSGTTVVSCQTPWHTEVRNMKAVSGLPSTIDVSWDISGEKPDVWQLTCTAPDGSYVTTNVVGSAWTIENLQPDTQYSIDVKPSGNFELAGTPAVTCKTAKCQITAINAESDGPFTGKVTWTVDGVSPDQWTVQYGVSGGEILSELISGNSFNMSALYPESAYSITISAPPEYCLTGNTQTSFATQKAEQFTDYGCKNVSINLYLPDDTEFENPVGSFTSDQSIVFQIYAEYDVTEEDKSVTTAYFIRDSAGKIVSFTQSSKSWSGEWTELKHTVTISNVPKDAGTYTLEVYFNDKILATKQFTIQ